MKKPITGLIIIVVFLFSSATILWAQCTVLPVATTGPISLQCASGTDNRSGLAFHPGYNIYYSVNAGSSGYPIEIFSSGGALLMDTLQANDYRGLWYNESTNLIEGNSYAGQALVSQNLTAAGYPTGSVTVLLSPNTQPDVQSCGVYDSKNNWVLYNFGGTIYKYGRYDNLLYGTITITGLPSSTINTTSLIYTGCPGIEIGLYDYVNSRVYFIDEATGAFSVSSQLPPTSTLNDRFRFAYANHYVWVFDPASFVWQSFNVFQCNGQTFYADIDGDNYGDVTNSFFAADCVAPDGYVVDSTDCNDANASIHPNAPEVINGIDDNCNGIIDDTDCPTPVGLSVINVTATSAKLKWDAVSGAIGYQVAYKSATASAWTLTHSQTNAKQIGGLSANTKYFCRVKSVCSISPFTSSAGSAQTQFITGLFRIADESVEQPSFLIYPNPAEDHATILFTLPQPSQVCVKVYDVTGKEMEMLPDENLAPGAFTELSAGTHSLALNTSHFAKGVYIVRMIIDDGIAEGTSYVENQKLIVE